MIMRQDETPGLRRNEGRTFRSFDIRILAPEFVLDSPSGHDSLAIIRLETGFR